MLTTRSVRLLAVLFTVALLAQERDLVFRASSNLVIVDVFVRDHSGKEIADLKKEDFTVQEDGKPQKISVFDYQRLSATPITAPPAAAATATVALPPSAPERLSVAQTLPGGSRYQDRRLIVLLFDLSSMQPAEQVRATESARKFLAQQMTPSDLVSVMTFSNELKTTQEFTGDRDLLNEAIHKIAIGEGSDLNVVGDTGDSTSGEDTGAAFVADETEFNIFNTDMKLSALETAAKTLGALPEKKAVVYFSSGINKTGVENQSQLRSTVNAAVRSNVSFYPVDARGLTTIIPGGGDASHAAQRGSSLYSGAAQTSQRNSFNDSQETLVSLASDTGGKAFLDNNNLAQGIAQAQKDMGSYYILGYYSTNAALDGRYRRIQVKLSPKLQAKLDYREGYYAPKEFGKFNSSDKESQLQQALMLGDPMTDLPLALEVNYFRLGRGSYFVPVAVKIPGSAIELGKKGVNEVTDFDFIGELRDSKGRLLPTGVRDGITVKLDADNVARLQSRNFEYDTGFTLPPGEFHLKFLARENRTGKMGTFETTFKIPDLDAKSGYLPVSSVIWSNQREDLQAAVGSATKQKKADAANPLVENGEKLIPSVTRVFRKDQNLYVYLEAYDPALQPNERRASLVASLSFMRGKTKAFETPPEHLDELAPKRNSTLPIQFRVPLAKLPAGRYTAQVSVVDQLGRRFAFSRAQVVLLP
jgi:VWFA-related protein